MQYDLTPSCSHCGQMLRLIHRDTAWGDWEEFGQELTADLEEHRLVCPHYTGAWDKRATEDAA